MINLALIAVTLSGFRDKIKSQNKIERRACTKYYRSLIRTNLFLEILSFFTRLRIKKKGKTIMNPVVRRWFPKASSIGPHSLFSYPGKAYNGKCSSDSSFPDVECPEP